jgi:phage terminase Nu1 subunit (DNA packaging protein)
MKTDILHDLDTIRWDTLQGCYEDGRNMPVYLRELLSTESDSAQRAFEEIFSAVWHQGTIYDLTSYVVPYLVRLLQADITLDKSELFMLLSCIADGVGYHEVHTLSKEERQIWEGIYAQKGTTLEAELAAERVRVRAVQEAVLQGAPIYIDIFQHTSDHTLEYVCELLGALPQLSEQTLPLLKMRYNIASNQHCIIKAIRRLANTDDDAAWLLEVFKNPSTFPDIKFLTIEPLVRLLGQKVSMEVLDYLIDLVATHVHPDYLYNKSEVSGYSVARTVQYCALNLPTHRNSQLCEHALRVATAPNECVLFAVCLLDCHLYGLPFDRTYAIGRDSVTYHFGSQVEYTAQPPLTPETRRLLALLIEHNSIWKSKSDFLSLYGFPQSREELAQILR